MGNNVLDIIPDYRAGLDSWYREDVEAQIKLLYDNKEDFSNAIYVFRASSDPKATDWLQMAPVVVHRGVHGGHHGAQEGQGDQEGAHVALQV